MREALLASMSSARDIDRLVVHQARFVDLHAQRLETRWDSGHRAAGPGTPSPPPARIEHRADRVRRTSVPYSSFRCPWISPTFRPRLYRLMILPKPSSRVTPFRHQLWLARACPVARDRQIDLTFFGRHRPAGMPVAAAPCSLAISAPADSANARLSAKGKAVYNRFIRLQLVYPLRPAGRVQPHVCGARREGRRAGIS